MAEKNKIVAEYVAEVARLAKTGRTTEHSFRGALAAIVFTDYLDFRLYRHGQFVSAVRIADWDGEGKVSGNPGAFDALVRARLKDRTGRALTPDDLRHYQRIVLALRRTREIMDGLSAKAPVGAECRGQIANQLTGGG